MEEVPDVLIYLIVFVLISFSALFSGLTLGLMGLSRSELKRKAEIGDLNAKKIYKIRKNGNLLLTTLLIGNVAVNATLSIFLGAITSGILAGIIATILIVVFGEIIPQAVFSRFALKLGAKMAPLVRLLLWIFYPVTAPIALLLDKVLGDELPTIYSKQELIKLIEEHEDAGESDIDEDEERILKGALTFSDKKVVDIMTPRTVVEQFRSDTVINKDFLEKVRNSAFSRFPIYEDSEDNIIGLLFASDLIGFSPSEKTLKEFTLRKPIFILESESLDNALTRFLKTRKHLFVVKDEFSSITGVLSLEDILEEILEQEIMDEKDKHADLRAVAREKN